MEPFDFIFNPLLLDLTFSTVCNKDTFDDKYRQDAISIGLIISDVNNSQSRLLEHLNKYKSIHVNMNLLKKQILSRL